jgi:hypothetical protein
LEVVVVVDGLLLEEMELLLVAVAAAVAAVELQLAL